MTAAEWDDCAVVGRVARAHGNRGEVIVNPDTDFINDRFRVGAGLLVKRGDRVERVRVSAMRLHLGRPIIALDGVQSMNDAEAMAGMELRVPVADLERLPAGMFYRHDLVGCRVETTGGAAVGDVTAVEGDLGASRLVVKGTGGDVLIPLAQAICPVIDIAARRIVVDPPEGLLELNSEFAGGQDRLDQGREVHGAAGGRAGSDGGVDLVDEQDREPAALERGEHGLEPLLEVASEPRAGEQRGRVQAVDLGALEERGNILLEQADGQSLGERRLADARVADEHRVVLAAAAEDLERALQLDGAADERIEQAGPGALGQVHGVGAERVALGLLALGASGGGLPTARLLALRRGRRHLRDAVRDEIQDVE